MHRENLSKNSSLPEPVTLRCFFFFTSRPLFVHHFGTMRLLRKREHVPRIRQEAKLPNRFSEVERRAVLEWSLETS